MLVTVLLRMLAHREAHSMKNRSMLLCPVQPYIVQKGPEVLLCFPHFRASIASSSKQWQLLGQN